SADLVALDAQISQRAPHDRCRLLRKRQPPSREPAGRRRDPRNRAFKDQPLACEGHTAVAANTGNGGLTDEDQLGVAIEVLPQALDALRGSIAARLVQAMIGPGIEEPWTSTRQGREDFVSEVVHRWGTEPPALRDR